MWKIIISYNKKYKVRGLQSCLIQPLNTIMEIQLPSYFLLCHPRMPIMSALFVVARRLPEFWAIHLNLKMSSGREIFLRNF